MAFGFGEREGGRKEQCPQKHSLFGWPAVGGQDHKSIWDAAFPTQLKSSHKLVAFVEILYLGLDTIHTCMYSTFLVECRPLDLVVSRRTQHLEAINVRDREMMSLPASSM